MNNNLSKLRLKVFEKLLDCGFNTDDKILKVARTIADMDESDIIKREHIFEALTYKNVNI